MAASATERYLTTVMTYSELCEAVHSTIFDKVAAYNKWQTTIANVKSAQLELDNAKTSVVDRQRKLTAYNNGDWIYTEEYPSYKYCLKMRPIISDHCEICRVHVDDEHFDGGFNFPSSECVWYNTERPKFIAKLQELHQKDDAEWQHYHDTTLPNELRELHRKISEYEAILVSATTVMRDAKETYQTLCSILQDMQFECQHHTLSAILKELRMRHTATPFPDEQQELVEALLKL
jgi:hypothetical protein